LLHESSECPCSPNEQRRLLHVVEFAPADS
jgi:hypothetical protein